VILPEKDNCGFGFITHIKGQKSNYIVSTAINALIHLTHRGAIANDGKSGDGCGLLTQIPTRFFRKVAKDIGIRLSQSYAVGMCFFNPDKFKEQREVLEKHVLNQKLSIAGWRVVNIDSSVCGDSARINLPHICQLFINIPKRLSIKETERRLFIARRKAAKRCSDDDFFYICSLSSRTIVYKALVLPKFLSSFYLDLADEDFETALCIFHQRFSTNTLAKWRLAQPFRMLAHNGEINTIQGNRNAAIARMSKYKNKYLPNLEEIQPLVNLYGSDSSSLDNMLEFLTFGGLDILKAMRIMMPPAWHNLPRTHDSVRAFYEFYAMHMESWDGPAGISFSDGRIISCILDRNGFRPARYLRTKDDYFIVCSEAGVVEFDEDNIIEKGRVGAGELIAIDTKFAKILRHDAIEKQFASQHPYANWLKRYSYRISARLTHEFDRCSIPNKALLSMKKKRFDVSLEEINMILSVYAKSAREPTGSMGDDTPLAPFSSGFRSFYDFFRQNFAQVTNPPLDSLREKCVMSLETRLGRESNIFTQTPFHAKRVILNSPILTPRKVEVIINLPQKDYACSIIKLTYRPDVTLRDALTSLCEQAYKACNNNSVILIFSDKNAYKNDIIIHPLFAVGCVNEYLISKGLRKDVNLIFESGWVREPHHIATLIGYGATAVHPYFSYELIDMMSQRESTSNALNNYLQGLEKGLLKIISKMGISTITSYRGAKLFEIIGFDEEVISQCFEGTPSKISGIGFDDIDDCLRKLNDDSCNHLIRQRHGGIYKYTVEGEYHDYNPDVVMSLLNAVKMNNRNQFNSFNALINNRPMSYVRDFFTIKTSNKKCKLSDVESTMSIVKRFETAAMSLGALSPEAHEALAIAMNTLDARSNSGEGGESKHRYNTLKSSKIKQVASGRFGVTAEYLVNAQVIQIKMAQGAKPGEGGQLPGEKVNETIASLRYCQPGVTLISPPPHHDIYSIEDLAQLIFDLKQINPTAIISVKLVSAPGVGTIACGVAKAYADCITISGYDGGTGASPLSSIKYAGSAWELGLTETQQMLIHNELRHKVRLQVDGGLKTGLDVVKAAIMGAENYGFGTAPMVALGCKYLRICHLNNCATGIATQNEQLRQNHYQGKPERVIQYFNWLAEDIREILASLGASSLDEIIGKTQILQELKPLTSWQRKFNFSQLIKPVKPSARTYIRCTEKNNKPYDKALFAKQLLKEVKESLHTNKTFVINKTICNYHRSIGANISGLIAKKFGLNGLKDNHITITFQGSAGQSFGAWNCQGLSLILSGQANDYVGKGMNGGKIIIAPKKSMIIKSNHATIAGNTCLYGATGGKCYITGIVGDRFCVRNSGATVIAEGAGAHCCEYMTSGIVIILGKTGINFGAGMTGGFAYVLDETHFFVDNYNHELIDIHRINTEEMNAYKSHLYELLHDYVYETKSQWGAKIINNYDYYCTYFWLVKPQSASLNQLLQTRNE
jgi:glutamate synthase (NADPH) large chain